AEAQDGFHLRGIDAVQVVETEDLEDVPHGVVEAGQPKVSSASPDLLDRAHERAQARAGDVGEAGAVDHDLEPALLDRAADRALELAYRVGVDEALRIEEGHLLHVALVYRQLAHAAGPRPTISSIRRARATSSWTCATSASAPAKVRSSRSRSSNSVRSVRP